MPPPPWAKFVPLHLGACSPWRYSCDLYPQTFVHSIFSIITEIDRKNRQQSRKKNSYELQAYSSPLGRFGAKLFQSRPLRLRLRLRPCSPPTMKRRRRRRIGILTAVRWWRLSPLPLPSGVAEAAGRLPPRGGPRRRCAASVLAVVVGGLPWCVLRTAVYIGKLPSVFVGKGKAV